MQASNFDRIVGKPPEEIAQELKAMKLEDVAQWFTNHPGLAELLDTKVIGAQVQPLSYYQIMKMKSQILAMVMAIIKSQKITLNLSVIL